jgi:hypothetical protein
MLIYCNCRCLLITSVVRRYIPILLQLPKHVHHVILPISPILSWHIVGIVPTVLFVEFSCGSLPAIAIYCISSIKAEGSKLPLTRPYHGCLYHLIDSLKYIGKESDKVG